MITTTKQPVRNDASFRDPGGTVFVHEGTLCRQINDSYRCNYEHLMKSGLYRKLSEAGCLISHSEEQITPIFPQESFCVIVPQKVPFISYPYEWCFSQLKDAALCTLKILQESISYEMTLKDCSAFNIQFIDCTPVMIDTLSFEKYHEGAAWRGYRQFCQHFLAPLLLMSSKDVRFGQLFRNHIDGLPLNFASGLLSTSSWFRPSTLIHIHMHAKLQKKYASDKSEKMEKKVSRTSLLGIFDNLHTTITGLSHDLSSENTWSDYYDTFSYTEQAFALKKTTICEILSQLSPKSLWDLGANDGTFSRLAQQKGATAVSFDNDHSVVEKNYRFNQSNNIKGILPLYLDLTNPSPSCGWAHKERMSLEQRGPVDCVLALALIHHLSISNNVPFELVAEYFAGLCQNLIIEFVPSDDPQVQGLLKTRDNVFGWYTEENFERAFTSKFSIKRKQNLCDCSRVIYFMEKI